MIGEAAGRKPGFFPLPGPGTVSEYNEPACKGAVAGEEVETSESFAPFSGMHDVIQRTACRQTQRVVRQNSLTIHLSF
jgi:hypothetical protein